MENSRYGHEKSNHCGHDRPTVEDTRYESEELDLTVVRIVSQDDKNLWGTGIVIGPNKVLTAAHVLSLSNPIIRVGEHRGSTGEIYTISKFVRHPDYYPFGDNKFKHDLAVITTNRNFWEYRPFMEAPDSMLLTPVTWTGYPGDLITQNRVVSQWQTDFIFYDQDNGGFFITAAVIGYEGQSGSGVRILDEGGPRYFNGEVIGVYTGGFATLSHITLLRGKNYEFVKNEVFLK
ncbi:trypsin-like serine peptidase [Bacillus mycoides]|uniref:Serine protease n=1 Tax=Bacillus mycoides TaxID=1405 RepID=A0A4U3AE25_BACMY|nr:serine protease [Bacillus mycoides]TKI86544.1 trypsin-like peptidase domain-containing protein [Bacillus mycoides]